MSRESSRDICRMGTKGINLGVGEVVFLQVGDFLKDPEPLVCYSLVMISFQQVP